MTFTKSTKAKAKLRTGPNSSVFQVLTNHWSEPLDAVLSDPDFVRKSQIFAALVPANGRSVQSR